MKMISRGFCCLTALFAICFVPPHALARCCGFRFYADSAQMERDLTSPLSEKRSRCDPLRNPLSYLPFTRCSKSGNTCATFRKSNEHKIVENNEWTEYDDQAFVADIRGNGKRCTVSLPYLPFKENILVIDSEASILSRGGGWFWSGTFSPSILIRSTCSDSGATDVPMRSFITSEEISDFPKELGNYWLKFRWFREKEMRMYYLLENNTLRTIDVITGEIKNPPSTELLRAISYLEGIGKEIALDAAMQSNTPGLTGLAQEMAKDSNLSLAIRMRSAYYMRDSVPRQLVDDLFFQSLVLTAESGKEQLRTRHFAFFNLAKEFTPAEFVTALIRRDNPSQNQIVQHLLFYGSMPDKKDLVAQLAQAVAKDVRVGIGARLRAAFYARESLPEKLVQDLFTSTIHGNNSIGAEHSAISFAAEKLSTVMKFEEVETLLFALLKGEKYSAEAAKSLSQAGPIAVETLIRALKTTDSNKVSQEAIHALGELRSCAAVDPLIAVIKKADEKITPGAISALRKICPKDLATQLTRLRRESPINNEFILRLVSSPPEDGEEGSYCLYPRKLQDCSQKAAPGPSMVSSSSELTKVGVVP